MTFNQGVRIDSSRARTSRGRKGAVGGGVGLVGVIVVVVLSQLTGTDLTPLLNAGSGAAQEETGADLSHCVTGADANEHGDCRVLGALESMDVYWAQTLPAAGVRYEMPGAALFEGGVNTGGCGYASSAVGPFYCPADDTIYLDTSFYDELTSQFGASGPPLAPNWLVSSS